MGTVNYWTSDYITLAMKPLDYDEFTDDDGNIDYDDMNFLESELYDDIQAILDRYKFWAFHVTLKTGYYEGFSIYIENNSNCCFDNWQDKRDAMKEATQLKKFLLECANSGLVACNPWWCTTYYNYDETIKKINEAIKEIREEIKHTPTWLYYERNQQCCGVRA